MSRKQKSPLQKALKLLLLVLIGGFLGYSVGKLLGNGASHSSMPTGTKLLLMLLMIPAYFLVIAWHEGGHALAGTRVGFDFRAYVVGPFMWEKEQGGWHFRWNKNVNLAGGMVICLPIGTEDLRRRFSIYAAGGPVASLVLAVLAFVLFQSIPTGSLWLKGLEVFFMITTLFSTLIFLVTAIPLHMGGFYTDGARIMRLQRGGDVARFEILTLKIITSASSGVRPKLLNMAEIEEAQALATKLNEPFGVYLHSFLHQASFDQGDLEKAEKHLQDYLEAAEQIPEGIRNLVWLDAAFFYACGKKDLAQAEHFWLKFKPSALIPKAQILATEAVIYVLKQDFDKACASIAAAKLALPNMMDKGAAVVLLERLERLEGLEG